MWWGGEGNSTPLQYSCLENPMDGGAWWAAVHGVARSRTLLSNFSFTFHFHALEKEMATRSSVLAWRIPGRGSLVGCCLWGCTESDATEVTQQQQQQHVVGQYRGQARMWSDWKPRDNFCYHVSHLCRRQGLGIDCCEWQCVENWKEQSSEGEGPKSLEPLLCVTNMNAEVLKL